jgi:hypothetical protein
MDSITFHDIPRGCAQVVAVDLRAVLLVQPKAADRSRAETLGEVPIGLLPALGRPVVHHIIRRLGRSGVKGISVVSDPAVAAPYFARSAVHEGTSWTTAAPEEFWHAAEEAFLHQTRNGADLVLLMRVGGFAQLELDELIQFHLDQHTRVTAAHNGNEPLDIFLISASRRNDAAFLLRHQLGATRTPAARFAFRGYYNPLQDARDLRQLVVDAFCQKIDITPAGQQIKPGVWVEDGARIMKGARVLAPAFIGARSKICPTVVLTRCACIEHHCYVDFASVVEDSTLLPYTAVGAGLDIAHSVVGFRRLAHLRRNIEVEITDPKLIAMRSPHAGLRALGTAASLATFFPRQILRGLFASSHREPPASIPEAMNAPSQALNNAAAFEEEATEDTDSAKFPANLVVARRYGDQ